MRICKVLKGRRIISPDERDLEGAEGKRAPTNLGKYRKYENILEQMSPSGRFIVYFANDQCKRQSLRSANIWKLFFFWDERLVECRPYGADSASRRYPGRTGIKYLLTESKSRQNR